MSHPPTILKPRPTSPLWISISHSWPDIIGAVRGVAVEIVATESTQATQGTHYIRSCRYVLAWTNVPVNNSRYGCKIQWHLNLFWPLENLPRFSKDECMLECRGEKVELNSTGLFWTGLSRMVLCCNGVTVVSSISPEQTLSIRAT